MSRSKARYGVLPAATARAVRLADRFRHRRLTRAETMMWACIKSRRVGEHFRRQYPTGPYILDFVCLRLKLVIEVDGPWHDLASEREQRREQFLSDAGCLVLHFTNDQVLYKTGSVVTTIRHAISPRSP